MLMMLNSWVVRVGAVLALLLIAYLYWQYSTNKITSLTQELQIAQQVNQDWQEQYKRLEQSKSLDCEVVVETVKEKQNIEAKRERIVKQLNTISARENNNEYANLNAKLPPAVGGLLDEAYSCATTEGCSAEATK